MAAGAEGPEIHESVLDLIGETPMVRLTRLLPRQLCEYARIIPSTCDLGYTQRLFRDLEHSKNFSGGLPSSLVIGMSIYRGGAAASATPHSRLRAHLLFGANYAQFRLPPPVYTEMMAALI